MPEDLLVEPGWLATRLADPELRVIDGSWYLPGEGRDARAEYAAGHLPGAVFLDLAGDLADPGAPVRNTMAGPEALARRFSEAGIGSDHRVVVYDRRAGFSAGRVWWALRYAGHPRVSLLDGGLERWQALGHPLSQETPAHPPAHFELRAAPELLRDKQQILDALERGDTQIVDARSAARFRGEGEETTRHRGHIPGSLNVPYDSNLEGEPPGLRSLEQLRRVYRDAGVRFDRPVITTCGSGVTAALDAFVLILLGHEDVSVYDGSWAEWGNSDDVPIESGG